MTQAYELSVLTGTQVLLLVVSETGLVYTFTTPKLQPLVTKAEGKNLIQVRNAPFESGIASSGLPTVLASPRALGALANNILTCRVRLGVPECSRAHSRQRKRHRRR